MIRWIMTAAALAVSATAMAKLPTPVLDEAAKAKAAEAAAKTAWQAKVDAYKLCQAQDRVVAKYKSSGGKSAALTPVVAKPAGAAPAAAAPAAAPTPTTASQGGSTPVPVGAAVMPAVPPCADPGPFAYAPPAQKPLETSGAHSPAATASSPPSVRTPSAEMAPAKPSTGPAKK